MTEGDLEAAFHVYIPQLERVRASKCYWPVLHVILAIPDICAALQSRNYETTGNLYMDWCDNYLGGGKLNGADWWKMRCSVLHLGSSIPELRGLRRSQYDSFSFIDPDHAPKEWHLHDTAAPDKNQTIDIGQLADAMVVALRAWFSDLMRPAHAQAATYVQKNLPRLVRIQPKTLKLITFVQHSITTSST